MKASTGRHPHFTETCFTASSPANGPSEVSVCRQGTGGVEKWGWWTVVPGGTPAPTCQVLVTTCLPPPLPVCPPLPARSLPLHGHPHPYLLDPSPYLLTPLPTCWAPLPTAPPHHLLAPPPT